MGVPTVPGPHAPGAAASAARGRRPRCGNDAERSGFVDAVDAAFGRCSARFGETAASCRLAGRAVALRVAGPALGPLLLPALGHLESATAGPPDLTICAWDAASSGIAAPAPPWTGDQYVGNGGIRGWDTGGVRAAFDVPCGMLSLYDATRRLAFLWVRDPIALPGYVIAAPFRVIFQWWATDRGMQLAHAAAVGTERGGVLLAGVGGAGKSTTALLALLDGLMYAGDDYVVIEPGTEPRAHSMYGTGKLDATHLTERLPALAGLTVEPARNDQDKAIVFVHRHWPERVAATLPLRAVLVPRVTGSPRTIVAPTTPGHALRALLPHSVFPLPGARHAALERLTSLVRALPVCRLELGTDLRSIPGVIRRVLAEGGA